MTVQATDKVTLKFVSLSFPPCILLCGGLVTRIRRTQMSYHNIAHS